MEDKILPRHGFFKVISRLFKQRILFYLFVFWKTTFVSLKERSVEDRYNPVATELASYVPCDLPCDFSGLSRANNNCSSLQVGLKPEIRREKCSLKVIKLALTNVFRVESIRVDEDNCVDLFGL